MQQFTPQTNGDTPANDINILRALEIIQNPLTENDVRLNAYKYLEQLKDKPETLHLAYRLAVDPHQPPIVRHFALGLLEDVIRHHWHSFNDTEGENVRRCVIDLGDKISPSDAPFIRNKIAQLWVEVAKRSWALEWFDFDWQLFVFWSEGPLKKEMVMVILENLSEDLFSRDDSAAVLRSRDLGSALVNIFTSKSDHSGNIRVGDITHQIRAQDTGWLVRLNNLVSETLALPTINPDQHRLLMHALSTLRSILIWIMTPAVINSSTLPTICQCLTQYDPEVLLAGIEALLALYGRPRLEDADIEALVYPMCRPENVAILQNLFKRSDVRADDIDSVKYVISKKLSELMSHLADFLLQNPPSDDMAIDLTRYVQFMIEIARHESLIVSIPAVHAWTKFLAQSRWRKAPVIVSCTAPLLDFACSRTLQYDLITDSSEANTITFVNEEIELPPERGGFFQNYRKFCCQLIELASYAHLSDAISHVLSNVDAALDQLQQLQAPFDPSTYVRGTIATLQVDAQFTNAESAFRGFNAWRSANEPKLTQHETEIRDLVTAQIRGWAVKLLAQRTFKDPIIQQRIIRLAVEISSKALKHDTSFALIVLEHILTTLLPSGQEGSAYADVVEELHMYATAELMRLAAHHADYFLTFYDQIESQAQRLVERKDLDDKTEASLTGALFLIIQRATNIDPDIRKQRLSSFLTPVLQNWQQEEVQQCIASFEAFSESQLLDKVGPYMASINAKAYPDWSQVALDATGDQLRKQMLKRSQILPLRRSRTILSISTERLASSPGIYDVLQDIWQPLLPTMVEGVMRLVTFGHRWHDVSSWPNLPNEMRDVAQRILQDRYWQSGITTGTIHDFHNDIRASKHTLEGFSSSLRSKNRGILEHCYSLLHTFVRLGKIFYTIPNLPQNLTEALLSNAHFLSSHHFATLLAMISRLIEEVPPSYRHMLLTPLMSKLLLQIDDKCTSQWKKTVVQQGDTGEEECLSDEMKAESILRSLTQRSVNLVSGWLDTQKEKHRKLQINQLNGHETTETMRDFILGNSEILEPLLVFCTHALSYRDIKTCPTIIRTLRNLVPAFATGPLADSPIATGVREYLSHDLLRAAITSLHDGHFVDHQKDIAHLIAMIWIGYGLPTHIPSTPTEPAHQQPALTDTPKHVLLSIPGMTEARVDEAGKRLAEEGGMTGNARHQRAIVLDLLAGLRGVRLSELGKIDTSAQKSKMMEKYLKRQSMGMTGVTDEATNRSNFEPEELRLDGVSDMFAAT